MFLLPSGCATLADVQSSKGTGSSRIYNASFETVWLAIPKAINELGLKVVANNKQEGYFVAERGPTAFSWGEKIAIFTNKVDDEQTRVEVVSKRALATNILAPDWEQDILDKLSEMFEKT